MYSYFIHISNTPSFEKAQVDKNLFNGNSRWHPRETLHIAIGAESIAAARNGKEYFIMGRIDNLEKICLSKNMVYTDDGTACIDLMERDGWNATAAWKGCFAIAMHDMENRQLHITIGNTGLMQGYVAVNENEIILTSELKSFCNTTLFDRKMIPLEQYHYEYTKRVEPDFTFLQNVRRMIPGYLYSIGLEEKKRTIEQTAVQPITASVAQISKDAARERLYDLLKENISDKIKNGNAAIPISGGVDSGIVASMVARKAAKTHTYTIGTHFGNEFEHACEVHKHISSAHREIHIDDKDFWEGFLQCVWQNEICDPLYAEGYVGFYHVFKQCSKEAMQVFTGYGADLVLGDFLLIEDRKEINSFSEYWCRRAAWTGEMSIYTAARMGLQLHHPFWETELIQFGLSLPYEFKYAGDEVKAVLREMAEQKKLLPHDIAWRKKNAFTTGASLDQLFSHCLHIPHSRNYRVKSIFLYFLFEQLFVADVPVTAIDINRLIEKSKLYGE
jgi:asparagine synthetase B (glutamine-hydrolysing)